MSKTKAIGLGALIVGVIALGVSVYAVYIDRVHYQETIKPHTQHDEIYNRLVRLDDKIERVQRWGNDMPDIEQGISELQLNLRKAKELRDQAELAWDTGRYIEADAIIREAHAILQEIPPPLAMPMNWWLLLGVIVSVLILSTIMLVLRGRRSE
jgi:hypothetical protein